MIKHSPTHHALMSALLGASLLGACTKQVETAKPTFIKPKASKVKGMDMNQDGRDDAWRHYTIKDGKKLLTMKTFDLNFDSFVDLKRVYAEDGSVLRDEMDMDFDRKMDMVAHYEGNKLVRKELMTVRGRSANAALTVKEYKGGQTNYLESDQDRNGVKDTFFYFKEGRIVRRGFDDNNDGQPDRWEELD